MKNPPKRVLVAGGNGVTGKLIVRYLTGFKLPVQVDIAARTALRAQNLPEQVRKIDRRKILFPYILMFFDSRFFIFTYNGK